MKAHGMYETRPLTEGEWVQARENLRPGANALVVTSPVDYYRQACLAEDTGFELRDCLTIMTPTSPLFVIVAQVPLEGTYVANALEHGVAGYNIDGSRIGTSKEVPGSLGSQKGERVSLKSTLNNQTGDEEGRNPNIGRYPSNVILMHHPDCECLGTKKVKSHNPGNTGVDREDGVAYGKLSERSLVGHADENGQEEVADWDCHPSCPVKRLDDQTGVLQSGYRPNHKSYRVTEKDTTIVFEGLSGNGVSTEGFDDAGGASRFFKQVQKPVELHQYLTALICPPSTGSLTLLTSLSEEHTPFDLHLNWESLV
jgi:hypothetical protein